jgi:hypothetical protein
MLPSIFVLLLMCKMLSLIFFRVVPLELFSFMLQRCLLTKSIMEDITFFDFEIIIYEERGI